MSRVVLSNAVTVRGNPWLGSWLRASAEAGLEVRELTRRSASARGADAPLGAHIQWPEQALHQPGDAAAARMLMIFLVQCAIVRLRRRRILLTVHNTVSHDRRHPRLEAVMWRVLSRLVTDTHLMSRAQAAEVFAAFPALRRTRLHVIPHGDYPEAATALPSREEARQRLHLPLDTRVLLNFGFLRAYKGTVELMRVFRTTGGQAARLVVAGRAWPDDVDVLTREAHTDPRIDLRIGFLDEPHLLDLIAAADVVVLPYQRVLNSGSALLALSCRRRVVVPSTPTFEELSRLVGEGWVHRYKGALGPQDLEQALASRPPASPDLSWCTWDTITARIRELWTAEA